MYCTKCGRELPPSGICPCQTQGQAQGQPTGTPYSNVGSGAQNSYGGYQSNGGYQPNGGYQNPPAGYGGLPPLVAAIRRFNGSTFMLVVAIVYSLTLLLSLADSFSGVGTFLTTVLGTAPQILVCIGMWLLYASAKGRFSVTGYTLANVGLIIRLVEMILVYVLAFFVILVAMIGISQYSSDFGTGIVVGLLVGLIVGAILNVLYLVKVRKVVTSSRAVLLGQGRELTVSLYPIVILGLAAFGKLIGFVVVRIVSANLGMILWQLANQMSYMLDIDIYEVMGQAYSVLGLGNSFMTIFSSLLDVAVAVLFLIVLIRYRALGQNAPAGGSHPNSNPYSYGNYGGTPNGASYQNNQANSFQQNNQF
jgi:hypothetical protein